MNTKELSGGTLAYLGDAIWSLYVRSYLIEKGLKKPDDLQKKSVEFVSAKAQAGIFVSLLEKNFFTNDEIEIYKRGRNYKSNSSPKNTDIQIYRISTGFEALIGYWYVEKNEERIKQLWEVVKTIMEV
ncbi:MAG: Mini-ribonuclease 3 [Erysipelotrichaceae bacterium]|nr:Mini-ribonuclease 3 [Erysipelotrichaceae bacterium]